MAGDLMATGIYWSYCTFRRPQRHKEVVHSSAPRVHHKIHLFEVLFAGWNQAKLMAWPKQPSLITRL